MVVSQIGNGVDDPDRDTQITRAAHAPIWTIATRDRWPSPNNRPNGTMKSARDREIDLAAEDADQMISTCAELLAAAPEVKNITVGQHLMVGGWRMFLDR